MQYLFFFLSPLLLFSHALCQSSQAGEIPLVFPGEEWQTLDPAAAGLDAEKLDALRDLVGGRGCVVRYGYMVYAWGDPAFSEEVASAFKPVLSTLLCFALQEGKLASPDEPVAKWEPRLKEINQGKDAAITWRHLASQTAAYGWAEPPGTAWAYNDFALALYYDTLMDKVFQQPGTEVLTQYIAQPLQFQDSYTFDAFGPQNRPGRLALSVRDFARYGLWILNRGHWRGQQILEKKYIDLMLHNPVPVDTPPVSGREADMLPGQRSIGGGKNITPIGPGFYSFNWWLNKTDKQGRRLFPAAPPDTFVASGHGGKRAVWIFPSLDLVVSWNDTSVEDHDDSPGNPDTQTNRAVRLIVDSVKKPYPPSPVIREVSWAPVSSIIRLATGSDNWPLTWADDGGLYTAYGDGNGFEPFLSEKLSLGFARVSGIPPEIQGTNIRSETGEQRGDGPRGKKASGLLMMDGILYLWARNAGNAQLAWSDDHARTWQWCDWRFTESFGCPTFLNYGKNYDGARDEYVYIYSPESGSAYEAADRMVMARVPKDRLRDRSAYEFFQRLDENGHPVWTADIRKRGGVFEHYRRCYRSGISYNPALKRYLWCQILPGENPRFEGGFAIFDAPEPWGPWTTAYFTELWDTGPGETGSFPPKWMSHDGRSAWLVFSGNDCFSARQAFFTLTDDRSGQTGKAAKISIQDGSWHLNGSITYPGTPAEGLLMNVRMVNSTFEDKNKPDFDPDKNTNQFIQQIPDYAAHGVRAFTLNLQGGMPGYEGAVNSAFHPDGTLDETYLQRVKRVIDACGRHGCAVILGCFYQRQDQILRDEAAVRRAVMETVNWLRSQGFTHVLLEIANEFPHSGFDHAILQSPEGEAELIRLAKQTWPALLVSTSGIGDGRFPEAVAEAADFILIHFNGVSLDEIPPRVQALKKYGKPIVCNEDDKTGEEAARAAELSVRNGASWGFMHKEWNQYVPFAFHGAADDPAVYTKMKELTAR